MKQRGINGTLYGVNEIPSDAYFKARIDILKTLKDKLDKGYELRTVVESLEAEIEVEKLLLENKS